MVEDLCWKWRGGEDGNRLKIPVEIAPSWQGCGVQAIEDDEVSLGP